MKKSITDLESFFIEEGFNVHHFEQDNKKCAEIEKWTDGGVDMIINLMPFSIEEFAEFVEGFDIDEEIEIHRQDERYRRAFTITESVKDFTKFHKELKKLVKRLKR